MVKNDSPVICMPETETMIREVITKCGGYANKDAIMAVLNDVQQKHGYLPYEVQRFIAVEMDIPLAEIYGIVTFYSGFSLKPVGKYKISVCMGTPCYVLSAAKILEKIETITGIKAGETSEDMKYTIVATRCIGACGLAPVLTVNDDVHGKMTLDDVEPMLAQYK
ncbi:MAG: NAD(P)H-dependent oxidoreductase subunit E [Defluviitaleaceae bacterium]|nr:NAD(P)H-dependent oxidoreductase subunit E [Defluviitaleaceae bacterium]